MAGEENLKFFVKKLGKWLENDCKNPEMWLISVFWIERKGVLRIDVTLMIV